MPDNIEQDISEFCSLLEKVDRKNPEEADIQRAKSLIQKYPQVYTMATGMAGGLLKQFLNKLTPKKSQQLFFEAEVIHIREELGYSKTNQLERLIIDQIMLCWAGLNYAEGRVHSMLLKGDYSLSAGGYWQENLTRYLSRYLRAIETLARIRKLNTGIALQFNIATNGGQQVNVNEAASTYSKKPYQP